ncbi:MAG: NAD(P)/FAD-dependent oxidoreductase [Gaiellaceae bacterium]
MKVDVAVVGGGPAGLLAARTIAAGGHETVVVERQRAIAEAVRTSGATAGTTMTAFGVPRELYHPVPRLRIASPGSTVTLDCGDEGLCVIDVRGVYRWLARSAEDEGARILTGAVADEPVLERGFVAGLDVRHGGERIRVAARIVVDAGGHRAQISKRAGLHAGFTRFGVGAEYELVAPRIDQGEAVLILSNRYAPSGYAWAFPWGRARVRLGVGVHHADVRSNPRRHLQLLAAEGDRFALDLAGARRDEVHFGLVPAGGVAPTFVGDGILAVGDAAGQATLVVGEGIRLSLVAGRLAGEAVVSALTRSRTDRGALETYEREFRRRYERDLRIGHVLNRRLSTMPDAEWDERLPMLEAMPPGLALQLLQSHFRVRELAPWLVRNPRQWRRAAPLLRALR